MKAGKVLHTACCLLIGLIVILVSEIGMRHTVDRQGSGGQRVAVNVGRIALDDQRVLFGDVVQHQTISDKRQLIVP